jgi:DNA-directed RNA polymerase subunit M/transcription elongation factor TFIIS
MIVGNPSCFRENVQKKLNRLIRKKNKSINLEKGIYNWTIGEAKKRDTMRKWTNANFVLLYINKFKSIYMNLDPKSTVKNPTLLKRLKKGEFKAHKLAFMSHQQMFPSKWKPLIDAKIARDKNATEINLAAATDDYHCFKCHKNVTTYYQQQTRSADEPMTTFISCLNCGNAWKQ